MNDVYQDPLVGRYTDKEMQYIFSDDFKFKNWRKCWIALAESQMEIGLDQIEPDMIEELKAAADEPIDYDAAKKKEKEIRHDVMAHVYEYGLHCPKAKGIIHLGATSQFVVCNTDLIRMREALKLIKPQIIYVIKNMIDFSAKNKGMATLGYTHYQPAQPTTVGKRFTLYIQDLLYDLDEIEKTEKLILARGAKGTTGTQATYMDLFDSDFDKVKELDRKVSEKLGFDRSFPVTGQTYPRKIDSMVAKSLAGISETAHKFAIDLRLMSNLKIMEEPFEKNQTGSSAMAYKRNPMRSERMTSLSRKLMVLQHGMSHTFANQWFERTLDDSAIRRIDIPHMFLLGNAILKLFSNITSGLVVYEAQIKKYLREELPFMATEAILMELARKGYDRQEMHELIKKHSVAAGNAVKNEGRDNDLLKRLADDPDVPLSAVELEVLVGSPEEFIGAAVKQTEEFLKIAKTRIEDYDIEETDSSIDV